MYNFLTSIIFAQYMYVRGRYIIERNAEMDWTKRMKWLPGECGGGLFILCAVSTEMETVSKQYESFIKSRIKQSECEHPPIAHLQP